MLQTAHIILYLGMFQQKFGFSMIWPFKTTRVLALDKCRCHQNNQQIYRGSTKKTNGQATKLLAETTNLGVSRVAPKHGRQKLQQW
jgi:hypothetical protein